MSGNAAEQLKVAAEQVFAPAFFTALERKHSIAPRNEQEAAQLLKLAMALTQNEEEQKQAAANAGESQFLSAALRQVDPAGEINNAGREQLAYKAAMEQLTQEPELVAALAGLAG